MAETTRRLAAIVAADVVGYSRLMAADETATLAAMKAHRRELWTPAIEAHGGRVVSTAGDGILIEFQSAVAAVECSVTVQRGMAERNAGLDEDRHMRLRVGVNLGEVVVEGDDIHGDGVNVAARLEALADPGGICLSGDVYRQVRGKLDAVFVDLGRQSVKNIAEPVHVYGIDIDTGGQTSSIVQNLDRVRERPAVAVLPFTNLSGDPEQAYFADGLTEDIITALPLWRSFPVVARNSTFAYKGTAPDVREVGARLGARYVLEGSVRRAGSRVRVTAQLIDAQSGHHVWAERYDRELDDIFTMQDELTQGIVAVVVPELERTEHKRLIMLPPRDLGAWDCALQGLAYLNAFSEENNVHAKQMFERAIARDPDYARGHAGLAFTYHRDIQFEYADLADDTASKQLASARRAVQLDGGDYIAHFILCAAYLRAGDHAAALAEAIRSAELNPSDAHTYNLVGLALSLMGRPDEALPHLEKAQALSPNDPRMTLMLAYTALAHFVAERYEVAADWARRAIRAEPSHPEPHIFLTASLGQLGRIEEARAALAAYARLRPDRHRWRASWFPFERAHDEARFLDGLRKAGWEG